MRFKCKVMRVAEGGWSSTWMSGWYQGEDAWNNDEPAIEADTAAAASEQAALAAYVHGRLRERPVARVVTCDTEGNVALFDVSLRAIATGCVPVKNQPPDSA